jgi:hypothetical protein
MVGVKGGDDDACESEFNKAFFRANSDSKSTRRSFDLCSAIE